MILRQSISATAFALVLLASGCGTGSLFPAEVVRGCQQGSIGLPDADIESTYRILETLLDLGYSYEDALLGIGDLCTDRYGAGQLYNICFACYSAVAADVYGR